ncbi:MAG TPA: SMP-30/gluconolactonase/LRE family protein, partial [Tichowtungia sp.]|nr:SMP-30/gluconolactonase/LRE family protein [Tichowtungia sp.]
MRRLFFIFMLFAGAAFAQEYLSPCDIDLSPDGQSAYITTATGKSVLQFDLDKQAVTQTFPLPAELTGLTVSGEGTLYVTGGGHQGRVWALNPSGEIFQTLETGHTPTAPVLSPDGKTLTVCNRFDNDVSFIDLASGKTVARVPVLREPIAADITPDGKTLFVANHIPDGPADVDYVASKISVIDTQTR